ncbi:Mitotic spindle checkpoint protein BUBR1 [Raphanus sativus]|nr:Mitotic spindle checkpoint protein BUBR1 [Raphanus sativus]
MHPFDTLMSLSFPILQQNVWPLKRGRNIRLLNHTLKSHSDHQLRKTIVEKLRKLIEEIDEHDGDMANEIFNLGISRNAKPVEKLNDAHKKFMEPKENDLLSRSFGTILSREIIIIVTHSNYFVSFIIMFCG